MKTLSMIPLSRCNRRLTYAQAEAVISGYLPEKDGGIRYAIRDIFRAHFDEYIRGTSVPYYSQKVVYALMRCGTGELGYSLNVCSECGAIRVTADKCGCRYCSACGYLRKIRWVEARKAEIIEGIPYYHVVFTVPHELNSLIFQNQKILLDNLFRSVRQAILELSAEKKDMIPGMVMVLHTFGSSMELHYHIHMLLSGGGLSLDKKSFITPGSKGFFLPVKAIAGRYRALFLQGLKELHDNEKLEYFGDALKYRNSYEWKELLNLCYKQDWNVDIRKYFSHSSGKTDSSAAGSFASYANRNAVTAESICSSAQDLPSGSPDVENVENYLAEYSSRAAITDNRIRSVDDRQIAFEYKDYRSGAEKKIMKLSVHEFIRRFLLHILPKGVQKIRYGGFLAGSVKAKNLALIRELLNQAPKENPTKDMTSAELVKHLYSIDFSKCPHCSGRMSNVMRRENCMDTARSILAYEARAS